jgi:predicted RNase H-like HicB family nuclease
MVTVEFHLRADDPESAEAEVKELIREGVISLMDHQEREPLDGFDVISAEPSEVTF